MNTTLIEKMTANLDNNTRITLSDLESLGGPVRTMMLDMIIPEVYLQEHKKKFNKCLISIEGFETMRFTICCDNWPNQSEWNRIREYESMFAETHTRDQLRFVRDYMDEIELFGDDLYYFYE